MLDLSAKLKDEATRAPLLPNLDVDAPFSGEVPPVRFGVGGWGGGTGVGVGPRHAETHAFETPCPFPADPGTNTSSAGRRLLGQRYYRVIIRSAWGSCLAIFDGKRDSKPYSWSCNARDPRQVWFYFPDGGYIMSAMGSCLAIYDADNDRWARSLRRGGGQGAQAPP